nr:MAG TPA: SIR2 family protein [Caudoviricetes sp.]
MKNKKGSILLSEKHGVNPSVLHCICCGKDYGVALLGKLKNDEEAPRDIYEGLCDDCKGVIDSGGVMIIEVRDGESGSKNPYRTGRIVGMSKDFKERNHIENPMVYMEESSFNGVFGNVNFK